jgi:hypothetical protein
MRRLVLLTAIATYACKPAPTPPPGLAATAAAAESFRRQYSQIACQWAQCTAGLSPAAIQKACMMLPESAADEAANIATGVTDKRVNFDSVSAQACLTALAPYAGTACWGPNVPRVAIDEVFQSSCHAAFSGLVAPGEPCFDSVECQNGYCDENLNRCPGVCHVLRTEGVVCIATDECEPGLVCGPAGICLPPVAQGADCSEAACQTGLVCISNQCANPTIGMVCSQATDCGDSLTCVFPAESNMGACQALVPPGGSCGQDADCQGRQLCVANYPLNTCASPGDLDAGCGTGGSAGMPSGACFTDLICDPTSNQCALPPSAGQPCFGNGICDSNSNCQYDSQTGDELCVADKVTGDSCGVHDICTGGSCVQESDGGVCIALSKVDGDCLAP